VSGARRSRAQPPAPAPPAPRPRTAALLFAAALALRLLFWQATADAPWPHSAALKGDAAVWLAYAQSLADGRDYELGLPFRPPGAAYLLAALSALGLGRVVLLKLAWCVLGALVAPGVYAAATRSLGTPVAAAAGGLAAASTGLLILSTSLNNETPYLVLAVGVLWLFALARDRPAPGRMLAFGGLNALACLFRAEHVLFALAASALLLLGGKRRGPARGRPAALAAAGFLAVLLPWHLHAWAALRAFNRAAPAREAPVVEAVETRLASLAWEPGAEACRQALPAFARRTAAAFVAATVAHRGGRVVRAEDCAILEEAFGYTPRPLGTRPFVALYGPLNFALANHGRAQGGFDRGLIEEPPPLRGDFPPVLVGGLPPPDLSLVYPPHLALVNHGYARGLAWMRSAPRGALALLGRKLARFWSGAALGLGGYGLPLGLSGTRHTVDLVVPRGAAATGWRLLVLGACLAGLWRGRRRPEVWAWALFLATKAVAAAAFFGYARLGASAIPAVAVLVAQAAAPLAARVRPRLAVVLLGLAVGVEAVRFASRPELALDGRPLTSGDPFPLDAHFDQTLAVR
jgi:hypothetical protein